MEKKARALKRRILIADHDKQVIDELTRALDQYPEWDVRTATSKDDAHFALQCGFYDLFIVDQDMQSGDGPPLINEIKDRSPNTVTVLMSGDGSAETDTLLDKSIVHHYLEKPLAVAELVDIINSTFPRRPNRPEREEPVVLKVVLGGDANVGKTSLIQRYREGYFDPVREMTIGVDFYTYDIFIEERPVRLVVWDLGGQERFAFTRRAFYRGTRAVGLIFDASNRTSFFNLMRWWRETREFLPDAPVLLLANKTDLARQISCDEALKIAQAWNIPFFESSCASGEGVAEFFEALAFYALKYTTEKQKREEQKQMAGE